MSSYNLFIISVIILNLISFGLVGIDKFKSKHKKWRIKEKTFFVIAAMGGSIGVFVGMQTFHHKTKHLSFTLGIPIIILVQILIAYFLVHK